MDYKVNVLNGDITKQQVDVIVNAANETLLGGGGVDGAIHRAAGPELFEECKELGGCRKGEAKITKGYNLSAQYVIHTVGPVYGQEGGLEEQTLAACYHSSLKLACEHKLKSIAFPSISTGAFGYPIKEAAKVAAKSIQYFFKRPNHYSLRKVDIITFSSRDLDVYQEVFRKEFPD